MAPLTWRNVATPNMGNPIDAMRLSANLLDRGFTGLNESISKFSSWQDDQNARLVNDAALRIQDPNQFRAALENGTLLGGMPAGSLTPEALERIQGRAGTLIQQATGQQALNTAIEQDPLRSANLRTTGRLGEAQIGLVGAQTQGAQTANQAARVNLERLERQWELDAPHMEARTRAGLERDLAAARLAVAQADTAQIGTTQAQANLDRYTAQTPDSNAQATAERERAQAQARVAIAQAVPAIGTAADQETARVNRHDADVILREQHPGLDADGARRLMDRLEEEEAPEGVRQAVQQSLEARFGRLYDSGSGATPPVGSPAGPNSVTPVAPPAAPGTPGAATPRAGAGAPGSTQARQELAAAATGGRTGGLPANSGLGRTEDGSIDRSTIPLPETRNHLDRTLNAWRAANPGQQFPTGTPDEQARALSPYLARTESGGRQWDANGRLVTSPAGAQGLMQLMPRTRREIEATLGMRPGLTLERTEEGTAANRRAGEYYLARQIERFGNNAELGLMAYNAGPNRVQSWINSRAAAGETAGGRERAVAARTTEESMNRRLAENYAANPLVTASMVTARNNRDQSISDAAKGLEQTFQGRSQVEISRDLERIIEASRPNGTGAPRINPAEAAEILRRNVTSERRSALSVVRDITPGVDAAERVNVPNMEAATAHVQQYISGNVQTAMEEAGSIERARTEIATAREQVAQREQEVARTDRLAQSVRAQAPAAEEARRQHQMAIQRLNALMDRHGPERQPNYHPTRIPNAASGGGRAATPAAGAIRTASGSTLPLAPTEGGPAASGAAGSRQRESAVPPSVVNRSIPREIISSALDILQTRDENLSAMPAREQFRNAVQSRAQQLIAEAGLSPTPPNTARERREWTTRFDQVVRQAAELELQSLRGQ